jgi:biuret amidohydrolase
MRPIPRTLEETCDPARLALVVYDMQAGIVPQIADGDRVLAQVRRLLDAARAAGVRVVFTRHTSMPLELMGTFQLRQAMIWQRADRPEDVVSPFPRDSEPWQLAPGLEPRPSEAVFDKIAMSAFVGTPLDEVLRDCGVDVVAIAGIALEVGIEPTARHAADLGYIPIVVEDACGAGDAEAAGRSLAQLRFAGDALLCDVEALSTALLSSPSG